MGVFRFHLIASLAILGVAVTAGCDDDIELADDFDDGLFVQEIDFTEARAVIGGNPTRVDMNLVDQDGTLVAREVILDEPEDVTDDEEIESRLVAPGFTDLETDGDTCRGTLTLALGGVQVRFDSATTLFEDRGSDMVACADFVTRIQTLVDVGQEPRIEAVRMPPQSPQGATDNVFLADQITIEEEEEEGVHRPEIEMVLNDDNLADCTALASPVADCRGVIQVLGLQIEVRDGTEILAREPDEVIEVRFDNRVESVDPAGRQLIFTNGTILQIVEGTRIDQEPDDDLDVLLPTLEDAEEALAAGEPVVADGRAIVQSAQPRIVLVATEVELEIERGAVADGADPDVSVEGDILDLDRAARTLTLPSNARVDVQEDTLFVGDVDTFEGLEEAFLVGDALHADVVGRPLTQDPLVFEARRIRVVRDPGL